MVLVDYLVLAALLELLSHLEVVCSGRLLKHNSLVGRRFLDKLQQGAFLEANQLRQPKLNNNQVCLAGLILSLVIHHFLANNNQAAFQQFNQTNHLKHNNSQAYLPVCRLR